MANISSSNSERLIDPTYKKVELSNSKREVTIIIIQVSLSMLMPLSIILLITNSGLSYINSTNSFFNLYIYSVFLIALSLAYAKLDRVNLSKHISNNNLEMLFFQGFIHLTKSYFLLEISHQASPIKVSNIFFFTPLMLQIALGERKMRFLEFFLISCNFLIFSYSISIFDTKMMHDWIINALLGSTLIYFEQKLYCRINNKHSPYLITLVSGLIGVVTLPIFNLHFGIKNSEFFDFYQFCFLIVLSSIMFNTSYLILKYKSAYTTKAAYQVYLSTAFSFMSTFVYDRQLIDQSDFTFSAVIIMTSVIIRRLNEEYLSYEVD